MSIKVLRGGSFASELERQLSQTDAIEWLAQNGRVLKQDSYSRVVLAEVQGQCCYLKYYAPKSFLQSLLFRVGVGRAVQAYDNAERLSALGIAVPEARACLLLKEGILLVTDGMPAGRDLKALWQQQPEQRLLPLAGDLLAQLHNAGLTHGDCKWSNLFWCDERLYLVDLESVSRARDEARGRDLARFTVNAEDLGVAAGIFAGFIDAYCVGTQAKPDDVVALMRPELLRLRDRHRKKYGERGAQLF